MMILRGFTFVLWCFGILALKGCFEALKLFVKGTMGGHPWVLLQVQWRSGEVVAHKWLLRYAVDISCQGAYRVSQTHSEADVMVLMTRKTRYKGDHVILTNGWFIDGGRLISRICDKVVIADAKVLNDLVNTNQGLRMVSCLKKTLKVSVLCLNFFFKDCDCL